MTTSTMQNPNPAADDTAARRRLGAALTVLRTRARLSQAAAGRAVEMTSQGWSKYETGKAPAIFQPSIQSKLAAAVGASRADLLAEAGVADLAEKPADEDWTDGGRFLDVGEPA